MKGRSSGPPRTRSPRAGSGGGPTVGVDLGGTKILFALVGANGRLLRTHRHHSPTGRSPEEVEAAVVYCLENCLGAGGRRAGAVGIGVAGQVDRGGTVVTSPNLKWHNVPLQAAVTAALEKPVTVTNDVRAVTFGEWKFGAGRGVDDLVCVFVGTGIGGGIVAGGHLRYGATETAGEVGHMTIVAGGRRCHCPNSGCLEAYAGGWAIAERAREAVRDDPGAGAGLLGRAGRIESISAATVSRAARQGDRLARQLVSSTAEYLAAGLVGVVNGFNPRRVVLGGGVIEGTPGLLRETRDLVKARALAVAAAPLSIVRAGLGPHAGALGAAAMARFGIPGGV